MDTKFGGFDLPKENWSKLPHQLIEALPNITSQGELMVILYILRHTWGYREFGQPKKITLDEFMHGRKTENLERYPTGRMDGGVGMSKDAIIRGLRRAEKHGFIEIEMDDSDKARKKRYYVLRMSGSQTSDSDLDVRKSDIGVRKSDSNGTEVRQRSEKETLERNLKKKNSNSNLPSLDSSISDEIVWEEPEGSALLEITIEKLSKTFGDVHHLKSNVTRAYNLWDETSLGEYEFVAKVEEAAARTKEAISKSMVKQRGKRMAYFFSVLESLLYADE